MGFNPMALMKMKERLHVFREDHPKVLPFLSSVRANALEEGTVMEVKFTTKDGKEYASNIRINKNDVETLKMLFR